MFSKHLNDAWNIKSAPPLTLDCKATSKLYSILYHGTTRAPANGLLHHEECKLKASTLQPKVAPLSKLHFKVGVCFFLAVLPFSDWMIRINNAFQLQSFIENSSLFLQVIGS